MRLGPWRTQVFLLCLVAVLLAAARPTAAEGNVIQEGDWLGSPLYGKAGEFVACAIFADGSVPATVMELDRRGNLSLLVVPPDWAPTEGSEHATHVSVDRAYSGSPQAFGLSGGLFIEFRNAPHLVRALQGGKLLKITTNSGTVEVPLAASGGNRAVVALERCLLENAGIDATGRPPASPPAQQGAESPDGAEEAVLRMLDTMLRKAGVAEPQIKAKHANFMTWSSQQTSLHGAFANLYSDGETPERTLESLLGDLDQACKGRSGVAYDSVAPSGLEKVRGVYSGRQDCPRSNKSMHFVALDFGSSVWLFVIMSPVADEALAKQVKTNLRAIFIAG